MYSYVTLKTDALNGVAITLEKKKAPARHFEIRIH